VQLASGSSIADLLNAISSLLWVAVGAAVLLVLRSAVRSSGPLKKLSIGPSGVSFDFADQKLQEATKAADPETAAAVGAAARRTVIDRLQAHAGLLRSARVLWVDDHPESNTPIISLLREYGAVVDTPRTNDAALRLLSAANYDVVISDVGRDNEGPGSAMKGVELAREVFDRFHKKTLLFTARFRPATVPGLTDAERLSLVREVDRTVFGRTNRMDEALHLMLDVLERE
jgi:CheY-like chemotaxis protein